MSEDLVQIVRNAVDETDLRGLDYLTEKQAARYCGVSYSQFREHASACGIFPGKFMGKKLFRKTDLQRAVEHAWLSSPHVGVIGYSAGKTRRGVTGRR